MHLFFIVYTSVYICVLSVYLSVCLSVCLFRFFFFLCIIHKLNNNDNEKSREAICLNHCVDFCAHYEYSVYLRFVEIASKAPKCEKQNTELFGIYRFVTQRHHHHHQIVYLKIFYASQQRTANYFQVHLEIPQFMFVMYIAGRTVHYAMLYAVCCKE